MPFKKGDRANPKGRPKGSPNKGTLAMKRALFGALNADDGAEAFFKRLKEDEPAVFCSLLGKYVPKDVKLDVARELLVRVIDHTGAGPVVRDREP